MVHLVSTEGDSQMQEKLQQEEEEKNDELQDQTVAENETGDADGTSQANVNEVDNMNEENSQKDHMVPVDRGVAGQGKLIHVVGPGDNFHTVSLQYGMTVLDIKRLNNLFGQNRLVLGTEIVVTPGSRARHQAEATERAKMSEVLGHASVLQPRGWS
eukprot:g9.t1